MKLATKHGISAVALGKVCRKLQIPLPGRGYRIKREFGKPVEQSPLPLAKDIPIVHRQKYRQAQGGSNSQAVSPEPEPTDPEFVQILALESRAIRVDPDAKRHKLVMAAERILKHVRPMRKAFSNCLRG